MPAHTLNAIFLIASIALSAGVTAQNVYKCGDTYSQLPCPGSVVVNVTDKRTSEQKAQTDMASSRDARTANAMEKARLQQEKIDLAANTPPAKPASAATVASTRKSQVRKKKKKVPEFFTAQVSGQKKKPVAKKSARTRDAGKS